MEITMGWMSMGEYQRRIVCEWMRACVNLKETLEEREGEEERRQVDTGF